MAADNLISFYTFEILYPVLGNVSKMDTPFKIKSPKITTPLRAIAYRETKGVEYARKTPHTGAKPHKGRLMKNFLKTFSRHQLTDNQVSVISKGLKFIPTPVTDETKIRHELLQDFEQFARRMRLQYIFHGQNKEPHPFHVKSNWIPPVQTSVALESYYLLSNIWK